MTAGMEVLTLSLSMEIHASSGISLKKTYQSNLTKKNWMAYIEVIGGLSGYYLTLSHKKIPAGLN